MFRRLFGSTANQYKKIHIDTNDIEHGHDSDDEPVHVHSHMSICSTCCFFINRTAVRIYILGSNIMMCTHNVAHSFFRVCSFRSGPVDEAFTGL